VGAQGLSNWPHGLRQIHVFGFNTSTPYDIEFASGLTGESWGLTDVSLDQNIKTHTVDARIDSVTLTQGAFSDTVTLSDEILSSILIFDNASELAVKVWYHELGSDSAGAVLYLNGAGEDVKCFAGSMDEVVTAGNMKLFINPGSLTFPDGSDLANWHWKTETTARNLIRTEIWRDEDEFGDTDGVFEWTQAYHSERRFGFNAFLIFLVKENGLVSDYTVGHTIPTFYPQGHGSSDFSVWHWDYFKAALPG